MFPGSVHFIMFLTRLFSLRNQKDIQFFTRGMDFMKVLRTGPKYSDKSHEKVKIQIKTADLNEG